MLAACARLILSGREDREHSNTVAAGLGGAGCGGSVEHALDDGGSLVAIGAVTELSPHVDGADGRDCLDAMVGGGGGDHVATGGADAQCANAIRCNPVAHTKEGDGCLNILDPVGGIFEPSRLAFAFAFALICRVESKG